MNEPVPPVLVSPTMRAWRIALVVTGIGLLGVALGALLTEVPPTRWWGIIGWLVGALVVHDAIIAMSIVAASIVARRVGARVPWGIVVLVQSALAVAAIITLLVVPAIIKKAIGTANPTVLPLDYLTNLGLVYAGLAAITVVVVAIVWFRMRRPTSPRTT